MQTQMDAAHTLIGVDDAYLEVISPADQDAYLQAVCHLVTDPTSTAHQVLNRSFSDIPFHLTYKCDGCLYNEFCMKWSAENDDLSLLPHITALDKEALRRQGITTVSALAALKTFTPSSWTPSVDLQPGPTKEPLVRRIAASWPVGPRIDELVHRAKCYRRWKKGPDHPRSRFNSQIPLEYAHAAWGELPDPATLSPDAEDTFSPYRATTLPLLLTFQERRLEAIEHIARDFKGNHLTEKTPFDLPDLATFSDSASTLADPLQEFVTIERHVDLAAWKSAHNMAPERRVLTGETLLLCYVEADQEAVEGLVRGIMSIPNPTVAQKRLFLDALQSKITMQPDGSFVYDGLVSDNVQVVVCQIGDMSVTMSLPWAIDLYDPAAGPPSSDTEADLVQSITEPVRQALGVLSNVYT